MAVFSYTLPTVGGSENTWGTTLNTNWTNLGTFLGALDSAELAVLDGVTATTAEINYLSGVTSAIQTQLDGKQAVEAVVTSFIDNTASAANKIPYATDVDVYGELDLLDEDDMASDSATGVATQQSTKAYVDASIAAARPVYQVEDRKASGTAGGTCSAATWNTRALQTASITGISGASLASNVVTLPAGTYRVTASAPAYRIGGHRIRLYDVTNSAVLLTGNSQFSAVSADTCVTTSSIDGQITLAAETDVRLDHYTGTGRSGDGLGIAVSTGDTELYGLLRFEQVS